jgi:hypothetical protein
MASNERLIELALKGLMVERDRVEQEMSDMQSKIGRRGTSTLVRATSASRSASGRMSEEGRRRISAAMKLRWAKHRQQTKSGKTPRTAAVVTKGVLSDAGRKKLSDMMKKRWAEKRKAAKKK